MALESVLAVLAVAAVALGLVWLRQSGSPYISPDVETVELAVISSLPTDVPTLTPSPSPTSTRPPNTPRPPTATPLPEVIVYEVRSGDTLFGIAAGYGVTGDAILAANADVLESPHRLSIGQELRIPLPRRESDEREAQPEASQPSVAKLASESALPEGTGEQATEAALAMARGVEATNTHMVQAGETISDVAHAYGMSTDELARLNPEATGMGRRLPPPGSRLVIAPAESVTPTVRFGPSPEGAAADAAAASSTGSVGLQEDALGALRFPAPVLLAPGNGVTITLEAPVLRWTSSGVLPPDAHYVVSVRDGAVPNGRIDELWVTTNATAVGLPAAYRPQLGASRTIEWSVSVQQRARRLFGPRAGVLMSPRTEWQHFVWSPGG